MADISERASRNDSKLCGVHHLNIPMFPKRSNDPPADDVRHNEKKQRNRGQRRNKRPVEKHDLDGGANQNCGVQQNHPEKFRISDFRTAVTDDLFLMTFRNLQLNDAQSRDRDKQAEKRDHAYCHCSSKNSALNPGPKAPANAKSPGWSGRFSSHSCRIKRMVALERLPTLPRMSQEGCVSSFVRPSASCTFESSREPPGCRIQPLI